MSLLVDNRDAANELEPVKDIGRADMLYFSGGDQSRLVKAIRYDGDIKMPLKDKLPDADIAVLEEWVKGGAPWPDDGAAAAGVDPALSTWDKVLVGIGSCFCALNFCDEFYNVDRPLVDEP